MRSGGTQTLRGLTEDTGTVIYRSREDCEQRRNTDTERIDEGARIALIGSASHEGTLLESFRHAASDVPGT